MSSFFVKASSFGQTHTFCAITNLLCIGYLLPSSYVVLRKGNVFSHVCLSVHRGPHMTTTHYAIGQSQPLSYHHHTDTCHLPPATPLPHGDLSPPPLSYGHLGPPLHGNAPPPPPPHTHLLASEQLVFNFKAFFFQCFKATSEL